MADNVLKAVLPIQARPKVLNFRTEAEMLKHATDDDSKLVVIDGLRQIIVSPSSHRFYGTLNRAECSDDDGRNFRIFGLKPRQEFLACESRHF